jgi:hypothetical protein
MLTSCKLAGVPLGEGDGLGDGVGVAVAEGDGVGVVPLHVGGVYVEAGPD